VIIAVTGLPMACTLPARLDGSAQKDGVDKPIQDIPYSLFLKEKRALMIMLVAALVAVCLCCLEPILVLRLEELGMDEDNTGLGYVLMSVTYVVGAALISVLTRNVDTRITVSVCLLGEALSLFIISAYGTNSLT